MKTALKNSKKSGGRIGGCYERLRPWRPPTTHFFYKKTKKGIDIKSMPFFFGFFFCVLTRAYYAEK